MREVWYTYAADAYGVNMAKQKPKDKGTKAESDVVQWAKKHGFFRAVRIALTGAKDTGDVAMNDDIMVQVKDGYTERKEPTDFQIGQWLEALDKQKQHGDWKVALLVHKRFGKADPDMWRWYVDGITYLRLHGFEFPGTTSPYVQLQGYSVPQMLKNWSSA